MLMRNRFQICKEHYRYTVVIKYKNFIVPYNSAILHCS